MEVKTEDFNPWTYKNAQEYLYFCCAECDFKDRNETNFVTHAVTHHSKAKNVFSVQIQESQIIEDFSESIPEEEEPLSEIDEKQEFHEIISEIVGAVRFKCSFCDYKSKYKQAVTHHAERVHLKKRDYNCDQCKKTFHQDCDLRKHINTGFIYSIILTLCYFLSHFVSQILSPIVSQFVSQFVSQVVLQVVSPIVSQVVSYFVSHFYQDKYATLW